MKNNFIYIILLFYVIIAALTIIFFDGTGDAGDSIQHYLFAKFAPKHPELYFDHWAKPVFVLLASPFAQFGFTGIKIFNAIISLFTILFTFKSSRELNLKNAIASTVLLIFSPLFYILTFSGLTEPLFALFISVWLYAVLKKNYLTASLIISFLPFVRSEGLIIICVFATYLLLIRAWRYLPYLLSGHLLYSIAGYFIYGDFLWVFNKIPYLGINPGYGSGKLFHFVDQLFYVIGMPVYILFSIGLIKIFFNFIKKRNNKIGPPILILSAFAAFFISHSLFWYYGIFNSMGLKRVLVGITPLIAIMALVGYNFISEIVFANQKTLNLIVRTSIIATIIIFPFTSNPAAIHWEKDMRLSKAQQSAKEVANYIQKEIPANRCYFYSHPYLSIALNVDPFDINKRQDLKIDVIDKLKTGDLIIWDNWFAKIENGITTKELLDNNINLSNIFNSNENDKSSETIYSVYLRK